MRLTSWATGWGSSPSRCWSSSRPGSALATTALFLGTGFLPALFTPFLTAGWRRPGPFVLPASSMRRGRRFRRPRPERGHFSLPVVVSWRPSTARCTYRPRPTRSSRRPCSPRRGSSTTGTRSSTSPSPGAPQSGRRSPASSSPVSGCARRSPRRRLILRDRREHMLDEERRRSSRRRSRRCQARSRSSIRCSTKPAHQPGAGQQSYLFWGSRLVHIADSLVSAQDANGAVLQGIFMGTCA